MDIEIFPRDLDLDYIPQQANETDAGYDLKACIEEGGQYILSKENVTYARRISGVDNVYVNGKLQLPASDAERLIEGQRGVLILPGEVWKVSAGFKIALPPAAPGFNNVMQIYPRSGLGVNSKLILANSVGIIDQNYVAEEVQIALYNCAPFPHFILHKARVAQALFTTVARCNFTVNKNWDTKQDRGGGLGHTGV
jgi:dUTP pyrophosphatase